MKIFGAFGTQGMTLFHFPKRRMKARDTQIPEDSLVIHRKNVWRLTSNNDWKERILMLTKEDLLVGLEGHDFVVEQIPLVK